MHRNLQEGMLLEVEHVKADQASTVQQTKRGGVRGFAVRCPSV